MEPKIIPVRVHTLEEAENYRRWFLKFLEESRKLAVIQSFTLTHSDFDDIGGFNERKLTDY